MKDQNHDGFEKDTPEEVPGFSDRDLEDYLKVEEEYSEEAEMPAKADPSPQTVASLRRQKRSKRSLMFIALLCIGLGILVLAVFFFMKPEIRKPQIVAKRMKRPIPIAGEKEKQTVPGVVGEEKVPEGGIPEKEKPGVSAPSEPSIIIRERGADKKVIILGGKELPKEQEEVKAPEEEARKPETREESQGEQQVAKVEELKIRPAPEEKLQAGRYTVNVGSFREMARAERLRKELEGKGYKAFVAKAAIPKKGTWYRVSVGRFPSRVEAEAFSRALKEKDGLSSFVRELKETER